MQIYELSQYKKTKLDEANPLSAVTGALGKGVSAVKQAGTAIASPFKDAGSAYSGGQIAAKTNTLADKAFRSWSQYANQRMASMDDTEKQAYVSGTDGKMNQDLKAFVQKNMLSNQPFQNLTVGNDILKVINQIAPAAAKSGTTVPAAQTPAAQTPAAQTPAAQTPAAQTPAAQTPAAQTPAAQTPAQVRQQKLSTAAKGAQAKMAANPVPAQSVPKSPEEIRKEKQAAAAQAAQGQMSGKPTATPAAQTPNFGAQTTGYGKVTSNIPSAIPGTNMKLPVNSIPSTKTAPVAAAARTPKVTSGRLTPAEQEVYNAKIQAALNKQTQPVTEAVTYQPTSQSKALFLKLAQLAASAQQSVNMPARAAPAGQYQQTQQLGRTAPIAAALGQAGINTKQLATLGLAIAPNAKLSTTGNPSVDALLKNMGFTVQ